VAAPLDAPMPADLDLGPGFTLRVSALAVSDGSVVSGASVSNFAVLLEDVPGVSIGTLEVGPYLLVPGPEA